MRTLILSGTILLAATVGAVCANCRSGRRVAGEGWHRADQGGELSRPTEPAAGALGRDLGRNQAWSRRQESGSRNAKSPDAWRSDPGRHEADRSQSLERQDLRPYARQPVGCEDQREPQRYARGQGMPLVHLQRRGLEARDRHQHASRKSTASGQRRRRAGRWLLPAERWLPHRRPRALRRTRAVRWPRAPLPRPIRSAATSRASFRGVDPSGRAVSTRARTGSRRADGGCCASRHQRIASATAIGRVATMLAKFKRIPPHK